MPFFTKICPRAHKMLPLFGFEGQWHKNYLKPGIVGLWRGALTVQAGPAKKPKICVFNLKRIPPLEHINLTHYMLIYNKNTWTNYDMSLLISYDSSAAWYEKLNIRFPLFSKLNDPNRPNLHVLTKFTNFAYWAALLSRLKHHIMNFDERCSTVKLTN
jgi:hypothetical protein